MEKDKRFGFVIAGVAAALLLAGLWLPRHPPTSTASSLAPFVESTVPAQLVAPDSVSSSDSPTPTARATRAVVYVCGDVRRPGVYKMGPGTRVADSIDRAGGALGDADLQQLNLAEPLTDAMKICVPRKGEHLALSTLNDSAAASDGTSTHSTRRHHGSRSSHKLQPGQTLDVNVASESELTQLPGVGPSLAARIVEYRSQNGPFQSVDDLQNVSGIGPSKFEKMAPFVRL